MVKDFEIMGEAASNVSDSTRALSTAVPWQTIRSMRNRLIHAYFDVDLDVVWSAVTVDIPPLYREPGAFAQSYGRLSIPPTPVA